jgi:hypothetical protein
MKFARQCAAICVALSVFARLGPANEKSVNPQIAKIASEVSEDRIKGIIQKLVSFGTRNTMSDPTTPGHGVGAARQWIF